MDAGGRATQQELPKLPDGWPTRCGPVRHLSTDGLSANPYRARGAKRAKYRQSLDQPRCASFAHSRESIAIASQSRDSSANFGIIHDPPTVITFGSAK